jgi:hypothetical protein
MTEDPNNNKIHAAGCNSSSSNSSTVVVVVIVAAAATAQVAVAVIFACPLFHSYIPTSVHLFIHHFSAYKERPNMCPLSNQYNCLL